MDTLWVMTSEEFLRESVCNKMGKNVGLHSIWFNGRRKNRVSGETKEYTKAQFQKYVATDFSRIKNGVK